MSVPCGAISILHPQGLSGLCLLHLAPDTFLYFFLPPIHCTLHHARRQSGASDSLPPIPCTRHLIPCTCSATRHPAPSTRLPAPESLHPTTNFLHPTPCTMHHPCSEHPICCAMRRASDTELPAAFTHSALSIRHPRQCALHRIPCTGFATGTVHRILCTWYLALGTWHPTPANSDRHT